MHHVPESAACADESKLTVVSPGTTHCRRTAPNTTHFRTIAPKVAPKIVSSYSSSTYPPSDVTMPGAKPLVINPQNYTLMKVAGHDGTFSLVALPQVTSPMAGSLMQTAGIPLQENLKLPIPRYQPSRFKRFLNKKPKGACKPKAEESQVQINHDGPSEANAKLQLKTEKSWMAAQESALEWKRFPGGGAETCDAHNSTTPCTEKSLIAVIGPGRSVKLPTDKAIGPSDGGSSLVRYESTKVVDSTNSLTVLSPVVFGSQLHLLQSIPKGKLPILPCSKMKKSLSLETNKAKPNVCQTGAQPTPRKTQITSPGNVLNLSALDSACQPTLTSHPAILAKQNGGLERRLGKKRKYYSEMLGYQLKMRLVGNKLVMCKDKCKAQADIGGKSETSSKKYRNIMPKPMAEIQSLASPKASDPLYQTSMAECHLRNRSFCRRWRPGDRSSSSQKGPAKVSYKCHVCDHSFQLKHHLQDHLNSHSNRRPHHCRLCRKAYVHSGSLSTHMKLHHSESRLKKLMCCEFCAKVFGHIRVYFGHLKEVHRVVISTESSCKSLEKKNMAFKGRPEDDVLLHRSKSVAPDDDSVPAPTDEIKLQIRCTRCPFVAPTFSAMKLHLFNVHGDESQEVLSEGVLESRHGAQEEVVKQATHHWRLLKERRNGAQGGGHAGTRREPVITSNTAASESTPSAEGKHNPSQRRKPEVTFFCRNHFNCLLCKQVYRTQEDVCDHWEKKHNCENPALLWTLFSSLPRNDDEVT